MINYRGEFDDEPKAPSGRKSKQVKAGGRMGRLSSGGSGTGGGRAGAGTPQAVMKVVSYPHGGGVKQCMDYIARQQGRGDGYEHLPEESDVHEHGIERHGTDEKAVLLERGDGTTAKTQEEIGQIYQDWQRDFEVTARGGASNARARHAVHFVLSAKAEQTPENQAKVMEAARRVVDRRFAGKHDYVIGLHQDAQHPHAHVLVNCAPLKRGRNKLRWGRTGPEEIRRDFARELRGLGLVHEATRKNERPKDKTLDEKMREGIQRLERRERQHQRKMRRKIPTANVIRHREDMAREMEKIRATIEKEAPRGSRERLNAFGQLRAYRRTFDRRNGSMTPAEIKATVRQIEKTKQRLKKEQEKEPRDKKKAAERTKEAERMRKEIKKIRAAVAKCKGMTSEDAKNTLGQLRTVDQSLSRSMGRGR